MRVPLTEKDYRSAFTYCAGTGEIKRLSDYKILSSVTQNGYCATSYRGNRVLLHRLAWILHYGSFPRMDIDHVNGIRTDNRICNLREASSQQNSQNRTVVPSNSKTGFLGVTFQDNRYFARIKANGRRIALGGYATPELAYEAYLAAKRVYHPTSFIATV